MLTESEVKNQISKIYNGGKNSGNHNPGQGRGKGKPGTGAGGKLSSQSMSEGKGYWKPEKTVNKTSELILNDLDAYDDRVDPVYMTPDEVEDALKNTGHSRADLENAKTLDEVGATIGSTNAKQYLKEAEYTLAANEARIQAENHNDMVSGAWSKDPKTFAKDFKLDYEKAQDWADEQANEWTMSGEPMNDEEWSQDFDHNWDIAVWCALYHECKEKCLATGNWQKSDIMDITEKDWK